VLAGYCLTKGASVYNIYFCLNGRKSKYVDHLEVDKWTFDHAIDIWPYDVIDCDDNNIWFDWGDE